MADENNDNDRTHDSDLFTAPVAVADVAVEVTVDDQVENDAEVTSDAPAARTRR